MSAWIVSRKHIDVLVNAGLGTRDNSVSWWWEQAPSGVQHRHLNWQNADLVGSMLWAENLASVAYRYPNDKDGERPGPNDFKDEHVITYVFNRGNAETDDDGNEVTLIDAMTLLDSYEYQSCEHPTWKESEAYAYCHALRSHLMHKLPGYNKGKWSI